MRMRLPNRLAVLLMMPLLLASCTQVPITGRSHLTLVDRAELNAMSVTEYQKFLQENKVSSDTAQVERIKRVGGRIQKAVEEYFASQGAQSQLAGYQWEFNLVESDEVNAWCMPGGKVVVYTGLLPVAGDDAGLAVVMGHEIAHAVAEHANERMSQSMFVELGMSALDEAMTQQPEATRELFKEAAGLGASVGVLLPYSRLHESEADRLGLVFMALAGYDPHTAIGFWERMSAMDKGPKPMELLSTHPADERRISNIRKLIDEEAMKYYKAATDGG